MLTLSETTALVDLLQSDHLQLSEIKEKFFDLFKPENCSRIALALRCLLNDNYYSSAADFVACQCELLVTFFLLDVISRWHSEQDTSGLPAGGAVPNTKSVLYEQLQKIENFIRERKLLKQRALENNPNRKLDKDFDGEEAVRQKTVLKFFILQCITGKVDGEMQSRTPLDFLRTELPTLETEFNKLGKEEATLRDCLETLRRAAEAEKSNTLKSTMLSKGVSPVVVQGLPKPLVAVDQQTNPQQLQQQALFNATVDLEHSYIPARHRSAPSSSLPSSFPTPPSAASLAAHSLAVNRFQPLPDRPRPPPVRLLPGEILFLFSDGYASDLVFDTEMLTKLPSLDARDLLFKAYKSRLMPVQSNQILAQLLNDPSLIYHCGLSPARLPLLVEHNPTIAENCLIHLNQSRHAVVDEFLASLLSMDVGWSVLEVVNRLSTNFLPTMFLHCYITKCIDVTTRTTADRSMQNRLVRLVCHFLQTVIKNKVINDPDLFTEVQKFCTEFIKSPHAVDLFRLLKQPEYAGSTMADSTFRLIDPMTNNSNSSSDISPSTSSDGSYNGPHSVDSTTSVSPAS